MDEQQSSTGLIMAFAGLACAFLLVLMVVAIGSNDETPSSETPTTETPTSEIPASEITPAEGEQGPDEEG
jgi:hypothetical protein